MINKFIELNNGVKVPVCAYGTYLTDKSDFGCINCVKTAIKSGIRHIDGAFVYGNQELVGEAVHQCINEGIVKREDLFIVSKIPEFEFSYTNGINLINNSLKKMNLDYFDMYLLHSPFRSNKNWKWLVADTWRALEKLYKEGKLKSIGVSNFNIKHLEYLLSIAEIKPMINQIEVHPQHQQKELVEFCKNNDIAISCWGALNQGRIFKNSIFLDLAEKYNTEASQIAIKWSLNKGYIPIVTSTKKERIEKLFNVDGFELSEQDISALDNLDGGEFSYWHTENEKPVEKIDPSEIVNYLRSKESTSQNEICRYKLFGFIPFLKKKQTSQKIKYYLFGIPVLKVTRK